jgi:hypothetical protein
MPDRPDQLPDGEHLDDEEDTEDGVDLARAYEAQQRLWLRAIVPLLGVRSPDTDPSPRVQLALDLMHVAACERVGRLMRSDLPVKEDGG